MISSRELEQIERYINPNKQRANLSAYVTVECYADEEEFRNKFQQQGW